MASDEDEDLELLRQAALATIKKKSAEAASSKKTQFSHDTRNRNLISILPATHFPSHKDEEFIEESIELDSDVDEVEELLLSEDDEDEDEESEEGNGTKENVDVEEKKEEEDSSEEDALSMDITMDDLLPSLDEDEKAKLESANKPKKKEKSRSRSPASRFKEIKREEVPRNYRDRRGGYSRRDKKYADREFSRERSDKDSRRDSRDRTEFKFRERLDYSDRRDFKRKFDRSSRDRFDHRESRMDSRDLREGRGRVFTERSTRASSRDRNRMNSRERDSRARVPNRRKDRSSRKKSKSLSPSHPANALVNYKKKRPERSRSPVDTPPAPPPSHPQKEKEKVDPKDLETFEKRRQKFNQTGIQEKKTISLKSKAAAPNHSSPTRNANLVTTTTSVTSSEIVSEDGGKSRNSGKKKNGEDTKEHTREEGSSDSSSSKKRRRVTITKCGDAIRSDPVIEMEDLRKKIQEKRSKQKLDSQNQNQKSSAGGRIFIRSIAAIQKPL